MTTDCFGYPSGDIPPSISDTFADIQTYSVIPFADRYEYHRARTDAMVGRGSVERAWALLRAMNLKVRSAART